MKQYLNMKIYTHTMTYTYIYTYIYICMMATVFADSTFICSAVGVTDAHCKAPVPLRFSNSSWVLAQKLPTFANSSCHCVLFPQSIA